MKVHQTVFYGLHFVLFFKFPKDVQSGVELVKILTTFEKISTNLVQKNQICQPKLKFGTKTNSNMENSIVMFTGWGKFGPKSYCCQFKLSFSTKTNSNMPNSMVLFTFFCFWISTWNRTAICCTRQVPYPLERKNLAKYAEFTPFPKLQTYFSLNSSSLMLTQL